MIKLDMSNKQDIRITEKAFHLENDVLVLSIDLLDYNSEGKIITAVFSPSGVESAPLELIGGTIRLPIYNSMVRVGVNQIQLNFRWDEAKLEQSGKIMWIIDKSLISDSPAVEDVDIISYLIAQLREIEAVEAERVIAEETREQNASNAIIAFNTDASNAINTFNTNGQTAIDDFIAETERVEAIYPTRLTAVENDLAQHKLDYAELEGLVIGVTTYGDLQLEYKNNDIVSAKEYLNLELIREKAIRKETENDLTIYNKDSLAKIENLFQYRYENGYVADINTLNVAKNYAPFDYFLTNGMKRIFGTEMSLNSNHTIAPLDLSGYSNIAFVVKNEHDAELNIQLYSSVNLNAYIMSSIPVANIHEKINLGYIVVPPKTTFIVDKATLPQINEDYVGMFFVVGRRTVPTEGNVEVIFFAQ